jgi:hypothetical protein
MTAPAVRIAQLRRLAERSTFPNEAANARVEADRLERELVEEGKRRHAPPSTPSKSATGPAPADPPRLRFCPGMRVRHLDDWRGAVGRVARTNEDGTQIWVTYALYGELGPFAEGELELVAIW